jgi:hypothetical protein
MSTSPGTLSGHGQGVRRGVSYFADGATGRAKGCVSQLALHPNLALRPFVRRSKKVGDARLGDRETRTTVYFA